MGKSILFFCRGKGENHAMRDELLADSIINRDNDVEVKFASYDDGYRRFLASGRSPCNIGAPSKEKEHNRLIRIGETIKNVAPNLIVSDEELLPLPLAKFMGVPSYLITNWFPPETHRVIRSYFYDPEGIIFPELEGSFDVPSWIKSDCVHFVGPMFDNSRLSADDREKARQALGIENGINLVLGIAEQANASDAEFLIIGVKAFKNLNPDVGGKMVLIAGKFADDILQEIDGVGNISVKDYTHQLDKYMLASDLVLTRGGYFNLWKLANMGIPSICVPRANGDFGKQNLAFARKMEERNFSKVFKEDELSGKQILEQMAKQMETIFVTHISWEDRLCSFQKICQNFNGVEATAEIIRSRLNDDLSGGICQRVCQCQSAKDKAPTSKLKIGNSSEDVS